MTFIRPSDCWTCKNCMAEEYFASSEITGILDSIEIEITILGNSAASTLFLESVVLLPLYPFITDMLSLHRSWDIQTEEDDDDLDLLAFPYIIRFGTGLKISFLTYARKVVDHVTRSVRRNHPNRCSIRAVYSIMPIQLDQPHNFVFELFSMPRASCRSSNPSLTRLLHRSDLISKSCLV